MQSEQLDNLLRWLRDIQRLGPAAVGIRPQIEDIAGDVAKATGASVRVYESGGGLKVLFSGRNANGATLAFRDRLNTRAHSLAEKIATDLTEELRR